VYKWGNVRDVTQFDFDLIYSFDETMKFLITFNPLKDIAGNTDEFVLMLHHHKLECLGDVKVVMKCWPEVCHAGFFTKQDLKKSPKVGEHGSIDDTSIHSDWSDCLKFWDSDQRFAALNAIVNDIDNHLSNAKSTRHVRKRKLEEDD
jgi:hypothetical protein